MEKHILTINSILDAQVCSAGTWDEALDFIQRANPAGTQNNWSKNTESNFEPIKCKQYPERTHYMFIC